MQLEAASLFKGEYLESLTPDNDQIDNWLDSERELWRLKDVHLFERLIARKIVHSSIEKLAHTLDQVSFLLQAKSLHFLWEDIFDKDTIVISKMKSWAPIIIVWQG